VPSALLTCVADRRVGVYAVAIPSMEVELRVRPYTFRGRRSTICLFLQFSVVGIEIARCHDECGISIGIGEWQAIQIATNDVN
jgi:hypothetical protein